MDLQVRLQVQVRHLILVRHAQELGERSVRQDATLERRVEARVRLDVRRDELGHLRLRALRTRRETHEHAELIRQRALHQEGIVRTARLPRLALLGRHVRGVLLLLLLGIARLTLGRLDRIVHVLDRIADLGGELRAERLELLAERREQRLAALDRLHNHNRRLNRRDNRLNLGRDLRRLRLGLLLHGRRRGSGRGGRGSDDDLGGSGSLGGRGRGRSIRLLGSHLVCITDSLVVLHF